MSDFMPSKPILEKWAYTRKSKKKLGDTFIHPRLFSTAEWKSDSALFYFACIIEIAIGVLAMGMRGFDFIVVAAVIALFAIDLIFAYQLHSKKQNIICKDNCQIEKLKYRKIFKLYEYGDSNTKIEALRLGIRGIKNRQLKYKIGIIISAVLKVFGFWLINYYGLAIFAFVAVLYSFAAYIHIAHTGFYLFYSSFSRSYKNSKKQFLNRVRNENEDNEIQYVSIWRSYKHYGRCSEESIDYLFK